MIIGNGIGIGMSQSLNRKKKKLMKKKYAFIDGAYLDKVIDFFAREILNVDKIPIDINRFKFPSAQKIFYYHALPANKHANESAQQFEYRLKLKEDYFNQLKLKPNFHVYEGVTYGRTGKRLRQKTVDVKLALDMLRHCLKGNMEIGELWAGDMDFKPLVDELILEGLNVQLWYHPSSISDELRYSVDICNEITLEQILNWTETDFAKEHALRIESWGHNYNLSVVQNKIINELDIEGYKMVVIDRGQKNYIGSAISECGHYVYSYANEETLINHVVYDIKRGVLK